MWDNSYRIRLYSLAYGIEEYTIRLYSIGFEIKFKSIRSMNCAKEYKN